MGRETVLVPVVWEEGKLFLTLAVLLQTLKGVYNRRISCFQ